MKLHFYLISSLLLLASILFVCQPIDCSEYEDTERKEFRLPEIFDFSKYVELFGKRYNSIVESLARRKIFLVSALEAFLSAVAYKHEKSDYYLGINELSDKTEDELKSMLIRLPSSRLSEQKDDKTAVASEEEVGRVLESIANSKDSQPGDHELGEELAKLQTRYKRDASPSRQLDISRDLYPERETLESRQTSSFVPSNNPDYQPIEADSFGDEPTDMDTSSLTDEQATVLAKTSGLSYLETIRGRLAGMFAGSSEGQSDEDEEQDDDDDDDEEFLEREKQRLKRRLRPRRVKLPNEVWVDHRESGCLLEAKHQKKCGSCYIFAALSLYEWQYCKAKDKKVEFSEQYVLDCGSKYHGLSGCQGGLVDDVGEFIGDFGLELARNYPYRGGQGQCPYDERTPKKAMGYLRMKEGTTMRAIEDEDELLETLKETPILMYVYVPKDFSKYKGGVHSGKGIERDGLHAMLLVGHGVSAGREYWLFRNSYGASWGEQGYFRVNKAARIWLPGQMDGYVLDTERFDRKILKKNRAHVNPQLLMKDMDGVELKEAEQSKGMIIPD